MRTCVLLALLGAIPAAAMEPRRPLAKEPVVAGDLDVALIVKWSDHLRARATDRGEVTLETGAAPAGLAAIASAWQLRFEPWLAIPEGRLTALEERAEVLSDRAQPDLAGMHRVILANPTPARLEQVGAALLALDGVEFVTTEALAVPPPGDLTPETPDLTGSQAWLSPDPGIDAWHAWNVRGLDGTGVRLSDCEYGWHHAHEDLVDGTIEPEVGQVPHPDVADRGWDHHGTAVAGEVFGQHNDYGVNGLAPSSTFATYPEWTVQEGSRRGTAITRAIEDSLRGDVVLLEMQAGGPDGRYAPAEVNLGVWTVVRLGVDADVIVVGAAGNGAADLDGTAYDAYRARGDSGAILVGAGTADSRHARLSFSTYGDRVDVQGWGQSVFTTGYGGYARYGGSDLQAYTSSFSGTSSASPFVAGSAVLLQQMYLRYRNEPMEPEEMRDLLVNTGTPAATGSGIGPLPDLAVATAEIEATYDVLPTVSTLDTPDVVSEGETLSLRAEPTVLETLDAEVWWVVDGVRMDGPEQRILVRDDRVFQTVAHVVDEWGRAHSVALDIEALNVAPELSASPPMGPFAEGSPITLAASTFDPGLDDTVVVEWAVDGAVVGEGETLEWTPVDDGTYTVEVVAADDDGGTDTVTYDLEVDDVAPVLTVEVPSETPRKTDVDLAVRIEDPGADSHDIEWVIEGDEGPVTGTGTPLTHQWRKRGTYRFEVTVTDDDGVTVTAEGEIEVVPRQGCGCASHGPGAGWVLGAGLLALLLRRRRE